MAGVRYELRLSARLDKDTSKLAMDLKRNLASLPDSVTSVKVSTKVDEDGLKRYSILTKDAFGKSTRYVASYGKALDLSSAKTTDASTHFGNFVETVSGAEQPTAKLSKEIKSYATETQQAGKSTNYFTQSMLQSIKSAAQYALSIGLIYKALQQLGNGVEYIKALDQSLTNTKIVTGFTSEEVDGLASSYNNLAKELGVTTLEISEGALNFYRQGKTIEEANELVRSSTMMATLGNLEAAQSTKYLTSIMNAYKLEASELPSVIDKIIQLDNRFAVESADVAEALQRSAVSAKQVSVSFEELSSMVAVIGQVTQREGNVIGTSLRTIFSRYQNVLAGAIDDTGMGINEVDKSLKRVGITIRDSEGQFRGFTDVLDELYPVWQNLDTIERSNIATALAGKSYARNHGNLVACAI